MAFALEFPPLKPNSYHPLSIETLRCIVVFYQKTCNDDAFVELLEELIALSPSE